MAILSTGSDILCPWKRPELNSPSPYPLPGGEGASPIAGNVNAPHLLIARRILLPLHRGEGRVRGNGCPELKMGSVNFHAAPNPGIGPGALRLLTQRPHYLPNTSRPLPGQPHMNQGDTREIQGRYKGDTREIQGIMALSTPDSR